MAANLRDRTWRIFNLLKDKAQDNGIGELSPEDEPDPYATDGSESEYIPSTPGSSPNDSFTDDSNDSSLEIPVMEKIVVVSEKDTRPPKINIISEVRILPKHKKPDLEEPRVFDATVFEWFKPFAFQYANDFENECLFTDEVISLCSNKLLPAARNESTEKKYFIIL
ncbi:uncharacterized protein LOC108915531 [Anoplophora glabripennis]|uniref:uncharacterized protein LOC108915531 n=1 Tax=Anoplophora glabripennis TaxID=217634 RepID=UPI000873C097|nr:uncharacterized protein LOC108915531 [Anoplophora glabripennis]